MCLGVSLPVLCDGTDHTPVVAAVSDGELVRAPLPRDMTLRVSVGVVVGGGGGSGGGREVR